MTAPSRCRARRGGSDLRVFHCARPSAPSPPLPSPPRPPPEREPSELPGRCTRHRALPFARGGDTPLSPPPAGPHPVEIGVARPSSCPSSPPAAGVAVAVAVTSRPLRLGEGGGGEGRGGGNRKVSIALAQESACARRPEVIRASHLHPEVTSPDLFSLRVATL